jgi:hypothetical protein
MAAKYLGIVSSNYTQANMATVIGTSTSGSSSENIKTGLNNLLSAAGNSKRYQRTTSSQSSLSESIQYTVNNNMPVIVNVKTMPLYESTSGHFILIKGYTLYTDGYVQVFTDVKYNDPIAVSNYNSIHDMTIGQLNAASASSDQGNFLRKSS